MRGFAVTALGLLLSIGGMGFGVGVAQPDAGQQLPWLELPAGWSSRIENGVVMAMPDDLSYGAAMLVVVPPSSSTAPLQDAYTQTTAELGDWTPLGDPVEQTLDTGWVFLLGNGVVRWEGQTTTALVAVGRKGESLVRFWMVADSDATYNHYQPEVAQAIASVQDASLPVATPPASGPPSAVPPRPEAELAFRPDPAFREGISGVYLGLERGARASAGAGGMELVLDLATNFLGVGASPGSPQLQTSIQDFLEVDIFLPDGSYRRRLPIRGMASDLVWDRSRQPILWGTWQREGDRVVIRRGSYTTSYVVQGDRLLSERERPWRKLPAMSNLRLEGSFARSDFGDSGAPRLVLHADGSYEDRGAFLNMVGSSWHLVVPDGDALSSGWSDAEARRFLGGGSGTYTLDSYTLTLDDRDGRVWQINAYVPPTETPPRIRHLVVNGYQLVAD